MLYIRQTKFTTSGVHREYSRINFGLRRVTLTFGEDRVVTVVSQFSDR